MYDGITFKHVATNKPLTSKLVSEETLKDDKYDKDNLSNSEFYITGSIDAYVQPPVADFAVENLYHMQAFNIFHYGKGSYTKRQNFHSFLLLYTYSGSGMIEYEGKKHTLKAEDGAFIDCRKPHVYRAEENWDVAVLHIKGPMAGHMCDEFLNAGGPLFHEASNGRFHKYLEQLLAVYDSLTPHRDLRAAHSIDGMLLYLLELHSNNAIQTQDMPHNIQHTLKYLEAKYTQHITLDMLAELTRTNKYHLAKEFKKYTGFSPNDYLIWLRINQAKLLLKTTTLPAIKIAHEVGIHDINNFNYLFKRKVGKTPIQYRNSIDFIA